ncbi:MAG: hypothetical protein ACOYMG_14635, partial [Candidatus Methylumidiphilus sp.]
ERHNRDFARGASLLITPEVPGRFGARGGLFTVPPLDSDRRHVIGAVLDVCREQSEDYVDRRKVDYRVQGSADTLGCLGL